uniref:Uncharacterized protein n=1 Tax=viral metagenome TaxID=1070528 RepID=A0A6C0AD76_9ZZZZ
MFTNLAHDIINYSIYCFLNSKEIIILKSTSKKFKDTKIPFLSLNRELSLKYYNDKNFKNKIHTLIENPLKNLALDLSYRLIYDVSILGNVHTLNLKCTQVRDVSMLGNVYNLNLSGTPVKNVSSLSKVHSLDLSITYLEDVSMLGNVHTLSLCYTQQGYTKNYYIDVSNLTNVHTLDLRFSKVKDISMLENIHTLKFSLSKIVRILKLPKVRILLIYDDEPLYGDRDLLYRKVIDRPNLSHVRSLILSGTQVKHISMLGDVHDIII